MSKLEPSPVEHAAALLESYASRGVFRGFSRGPEKQGRATFKITWHRDRVFELIFDTRRGSFEFPSVLPKVPARSAMLADLASFVALRQSEEVPEHRRIDPAIAAVKTGSRGGDAWLTITALDGNWEYALKKLIHLVHEIYLVFLHDGRYYDYLIETFNLDPDYIQFS